MGAHNPNQRCSSSPEPVQGKSLSISQPNGGDQATVDWDDRDRPGSDCARSRTPYCDTILLTSVRSIWMPRSGCWILCVMIGLWATTCPAPSVVQALLSAGVAVGGLTVGRRCEDELYSLPTDVQPRRPSSFRRRRRSARARAQVCNDRAAFAFSVNFMGACVAVGTSLLVQFLSGFDLG